jgi:excisionase family DNA binding protein
MHLASARERCYLFMQDIGKDQKVLFLQTPDLAERLGVSIRTIERWRRDGIIPFKKVSRRVVLHRLDEVLKALEAFDSPARIPTEGVLR